MLNLSSARALAGKSILKAQQNQKDQYDRYTNSSKLKVGDWILKHFPQEESGKYRKYLDHSMGCIGKLNNTIPGEEEDDHADLAESENDLKEQTEPEITATFLPEVMIEDVASTSPTAGKSCPTKTKKQPRCPYSLRSCRLNNEEIEHKRMLEMSLAEGEVIIQVLTLVMDLYMYM